MRTPTETSPYNLLQEQLRHDPWKLLVAVIMLNQTSAKQVKKVIWKFFEEYPDPDSFCSRVMTQREGLLIDDPKWMKFVEMIRPLGFYNRRANTLYRMSREYIHTRDLFSPPPEVIRPIPTGAVRLFYGIGKYAADSYRMFIEGTIVEDVLDKELRNYVEWTHERTEGRYSRKSEKSDSVRS